MKTWFVVDKRGHKHRVYGHKYDVIEERLIFFEGDKNISARFEKGAWEAFYSTRSADKPVTYPVNTLNATPNSIRY